MENRLKRILLLSFIFLFSKGAIARVQVPDTLNYGEYQATLDQVSNPILKNREDTVSWLKEMIKLDNTYIMNKEHIMNGVLDSTIWSVRWLLMSNFNHVVEYLGGVGASVMVFPDYDFVWGGNSNILLSEPNSYYVVIED